ncbi:MAG: Zn-dependent exopeptidase M28 [Bacilli bacterium]|nr:Zn-dependent exopeptidase M28 [Bacilli bacterium]
MKDYKSFEFLKKIYFERTGGSEEELKAAKLIQAEVKKLGGSAKIEKFDVDSSVIEVARLIVNGKDIECGGCGYSGSTEDYGVTGEFLFLGSKDELEMTNLKGKIVLVTSKRVPHDFYKKGIKDGALGFILTTGDVYKDDKDVDIDPYLNREADYKLGLIPTVMIRMADAEKLVEENPKEVTIILKANDGKAKSSNVIARIPGEMDEVISFTAHYDSVRFSKGIYDNATGSITLLQLFDYFINNKPKRTLEFVWCGSEEMGLLGSKNYVSKHENELDKHVLNINIDMVAATLGYDLACVTGSNDIVNYIKFASKELGFPIRAYQGVYSSDSTPFADKGIPAISFARLSPRGGAVIHSHDDVIERLSEDNYIRTYSFIIGLVSRWVNAIVFPIKKEMPSEMRDKLDEYLLKKDS